MKICNASGNGVCVNCSGIPPNYNGESCGDICRKTVQKIIDKLSDGDMVHYDHVINAFLYISEIDYINGDEWSAV